MVRCDHSEETMPKSDLQMHVDKLVKQHGGLRAAARATGVDSGYLWKMRKGRCTNPTAETLKKLGLERVETIQTL